MALDIIADRRLVLAARALQVMFAILIIGTDSYAIHSFHSHTVLTHTPFGDFHETYGVPNAWGFLMFCAAWTILAVIFHSITEPRFAHHPLIRYTRIAVEFVALLSWFAGFIAVAVSIGTDVCPATSKTCSPLIVATIFGGFEWLLFMVTTIQTSTIGSTAMAARNRLELAQRVDPL